MPEENLSNSPDTIGSADSEVEAASNPRRTTSIAPELLEQIKEEARVQAISVVAHESHSGPMPPPRQLAQYEEVLPGTAKIIRDEFQANGAHVRLVEMRAMELQKDDNDKNRTVAQQLVWGALVASVLLALADQQWVAGTIAVSTVGAVVTGFLNRRSTSSDQASSPSDERDDVT